MTGHSNSAADTEVLQLGPLPDRLDEGSTVLVASIGDPSVDAISLQILRQYGTAADTAFVVTTTESAAQTIETYTSLARATDCPSLKIVDTVSEQQTVSALYGETPVVFTPSPGDLEQLVVMLSELAGHTASATGARHLVIRSLTPILESAATTQVCTTLDRITGLRSETGLCLLGLDYTAHDTETMMRLTDHVDGVLWVTQSSSGQLEFKYQPTRRRYSHERSLFGGET